MFKEFKEFALKGNVMDLAIGIIIGGAFGKIVTSLVNDVIMPPIGLILGGVNFTDLTVVMKEATADKPAIVLNYGNFLQTTFDFLIVSLAVFFLVKAINSAKRKEEEVAGKLTTASPEVGLLTEIRNLLKLKNSN